MNKDNIYLNQQQKKKIISIIESDNITKHFTSMKISANSIYGMTSTINTPFVWYDN